MRSFVFYFFFFFQAEDGIRDPLVTGVQTCALPIFARDAMIGAALSALVAERAARSWSARRRHEDRFVVGARLAAEGDAWNLPPLTKRDTAATAPLDALDFQNEPRFLTPPKLPEPARPWRG